jgi:hypothetical protein
MSGDNVTLLPAWKNAAAELFSGTYGYGDIVPHDELRAALRLPKPAGKVTAEEFEGWQLALVAQIDALSTLLLEERNMCLRAIPGQGYQILEPAQQTEYAMGHGIKRVRAELRKMGRRLTYLDRGRLTNEQARENADAMARLSWLQQQAKRSTRMRFADKPETKKIG